MTVLVKVDIKNELPPDEEILCENETGDKHFGYYDSEISVCESEGVLLTKVKYSYKEVTLPTINELNDVVHTCIINADDTIEDTFECGFIHGAKYILSLLKPKD